MKPLFKTTDLCDAHSTKVQVAEPIFSNFGGKSAFHGKIRTVKLFEDNSFVRQALEEKSTGEILVVDGGGSLRCALLGDLLGELAVKNGWAGIVLFGCVRDSAVLRTLDLGVRALASHPRKSEKRNEGQRDVSVRFAGILFEPGHVLYADDDGILVASQPLHV